MKFSKIYNINFSGIVGCGLLLLMLIVSKSNAQVQSPCDADPFCSDSSYVFPNATSGTVPPSLNLGCLGSAPFPMWYWMQIGTAGPMQLTMVQTGSGGTQLDIDFSMFGPYTDVATGCAAILAGAAPIQCSFSGSYTETIGLGLPGGFGGGASTPPAAQVGEVYIVLLTNYSQTAGSISFSQTGGTGAADCGIVCGLSAMNSGDVCLGNPVTLTATNTDSTQAFSYYWTGTGGYTSNAKVATFFATAAGVYNFDVIAVSPDNDTCFASTSVEIFAKPNAALVDGTDKVLCNIGSTDLVIANPVAGETYQWYRDNVAMPGDTTSQLTVDSTGHYKVVVQNGNGCMDSSNSVYVKLNFTDVDYSFSISKACNNDTVRFTNLSEPGHYSWDYGDVTFPEDTTANPTHIYASQNAYVVRLKMTDLDGCVDSISKVVDVTHPLNAVFSQSVDTICRNAGIPVNFTDASVGATHWSWSFGEGSPAISQNPSFVFTQAGYHQIRLVVSDDIPCYDTAVKYIQVDAVPYFDVTQDRYAICVGEGVDFEPHYLQSTIRNVSWNFGDGTTWNEMGATSHKYENPGLYWITADADFGACGISHSSDSVVVNAFPIVDLGPDSVLCLDGPSITVADARNAADPSMHWMWNTGAVTSSIEVVHPGTYSVTASKNDCATTESVEINKDCYTDIPNAFTPNGDGVNDYFYPKQLLSKGVVGFTMTVFDRWGQKIFETTNANGRGWDGRFNDKPQPMGVYIYQIKAVLKNGRIEDYSGNVTLMR